MTISFKDRFYMKKQIIACLVDENRILLESTLLDVGWKYEDWWQYNDNETLLQTLLASAPDEVLFRLID